MSLDLHLFQSRDIGRMERMTCQSLSLRAPQPPAVVRAKAKHHFYDVLIGAAHSQRDA